VFATERIGSVALFFAALVCGLVIAVGCQPACRPRLVLISAALLPQILLNVPLTTVLFTHGAGILFLLWYVTPRMMFMSNQPARPSPPR
jgi:hypothetical protein